jgi:hypothetical protein
MRKILLSERKLVVILFVMVFVIFSLAQEDTKKIEKLYENINSTTASSLDAVNNPEGRSKTTKDNIVPAIQFR